MSTEHECSSVYMIYVLVRLVCMWKYTPSNVAHCAYAVHPFLQADLGAARDVLRLEGEQYIASTEHTPARWMPLEALMEGKFSHKSDVWASVSTFLVDAVEWICSFTNLPNTDIDDESTAGVRCATLGDHQPRQDTVGRLRGGRHGRRPSYVTGSCCLLQHAGVESWGRELG